ncbi:UNVERIFIED_CONTAM: hypothetical protein Sangu_2605100 [Sesamum angustifolium]|uniref:Uncharacterized protein n=1 Tax=Sesamum angustifolium TaxID=2727405 RepID=A0AAW2J596_9LAMI
MERGVGGATASSSLDLSYLARPKAGKHKWKLAVKAEPWGAAGVGVGWGEDDCSNELI